MASLSVSAIPPKCAELLVLPLSCYRGPVPPLRRCVGYLLAMGMNAVDVSVGFLAY